MKLKIKNNGRCVLEIDEFYAFDFVNEHEILDKIKLLAQEFVAQRTAYNMWEFKTQEDAEKFIFLYSLKYANKS